ncbi:poly-gamma-glutamate hydrolase family protein [Bacillus glycinifermentans]|uniref:poly-gamma-glutamate hydrolase family protein n=1 Tax=Bacillus glycinifermentans TaxID=1664069 RepID=UPI0022E94DA0|nr:poly-gamma-glutamate hydrolase family protein [Bacillus glycinifermentans]MEC3605740.1 poly-gamma-glutamate hydrolase family protein [Bacillus glycinifermentans]
MKKKVFIYLAIAAVMINGVCRWAEKTSREEFQRQAGDRYANFEELKAHEKNNYSIDYHEEAGSDCLIFSPHGGRIEGGVSELVRAFNDDFSTYLFEGKKDENNSNLHLTSTNFDEPLAMQKIKEYHYTIAFHGYSGDQPHTLVGGTDRRLAKAIVRSLEKSDFSAELVKKDGKFAGTNPENINNESQSGLSVQLEISTAQRKKFFEDFSYKKRAETKTRTFYRYVRAVRKVLEDKC